MKITVSHKEFGYHYQLDTWNFVVTDREVDELSYSLFGKLPRNLDLIETKTLERHMNLIFVKNIEDKIMMLSPLENEVKQ